MEETANDTLQLTKEEFNKIVEEIEDEENERVRTELRIEAIKKRIQVIDVDVGVMAHKRDCLDVLLIEIDKGYDKILASSQCLSILATRKLRMLKRKYSKYI